jgi:hypothetical protein
MPLPSYTCYNIMSYKILRGCWCEIIGLNVKIDNMKTKFPEQLEHVFDSSLNIIWKYC